MPTVEKVAGGRVSIRDIGHFEVGDRADVSESDAEYLVDERGDFARVDDEDSAEKVQEARNAVTPIEEAGDDLSAEDVDVDEDGDICGTEMSDGGICERPAGACPYHGDEED